MEYTLTLTETLKIEILKRYKNVKQFSDTSGIPYMTISSVLKRGVENSVFGTVLRICEALKMSIDDLIHARAFNSIEMKFLRLGDNYTLKELKADLLETKIINLSPDDEVVNEIIDDLTKDYYNTLKTTLKNSLATLN